MTSTTQVLLAAPFADLAGQPTEVCGGKGLGLATMEANDFAVAPGFVVTGAAFEAFLAVDGLQARIIETVAEIPAGDSSAQTAAARHLQEMVGAAELPASVREAVTEAYRALAHSVGVEEPSVAVRSSASAEDSATASFAGEFESWIDVVGAQGVLEHIRKCYQSLYSDRVLGYMVDRGLDPTSICMAVVVQKTVRARAAGVMFTLDPLNADRSSVVLEANWGLGLGVVGGEVVPDRFVVDKVTRQITRRVLGSKDTVYLRGDEGPVAQIEDKRNRFCLTDEEVLQLADLGCRLEKFHSAAQDIEFAIDDELPQGRNVLLLQCRPETYWSARASAPLFAPQGSMMSWVSQAMSAPEATFPPKGVHQHD